MSSGSKLLIVEFWVKQYGHEMETESIVKLWLGFGTYTKEKQLYCYSKGVENYYTRIIIVCKSIIILKINRVFIVVIIKLSNKPTRSYFYSRCITLVNDNEINTTN